MTETELDLPGIIIKENQLAELAPSSFYRLKVRVSPDIGPSGNAAYQFRMNAPPIAGKCIVTPASGVALKTEFVFMCTGWQVRRVISSLATSSSRNLKPSFTGLSRQASHAI